MTDQRTIDIVRASAAYRAADAVLRAVEAGWNGSRARAQIKSVAGDRLRFWSVAALTAAATALVVMPLGGDPRPLAWVVPTLVGAVSLLILLSASR